MAATLLAQPAMADEGLTTTARSRYVLDAKATDVNASITLELRNTTVDQADRYFYYDAFSVPVPAGAQDVRARSGGSPLRVRLTGTEDPSTALARVSFPELRSGRSRTIELTFTVPGEKPRDADTTRVGPGYATFAVYGVGDPGRSTVEVVAPTSMTFDATSDDFAASAKGSTTTHTATASDEDGFWAVVSLRDPARTTERTVEVAGTSVVLSGFPDDPAWADFVAEQVTEGLPVLEDLVGTPWPGGLERIREDASPSVRGYDGWFDPDDDEIVVGEQLDADLIFHELSHAWVSEDRFAERWVSEGLAQVLAERTVKATGGDPVDHLRVSPSEKAAVPLNEWDAGAGHRSEAVDAYAYPAAFTATSGLVADLDDAELARLVAAGIRGERAYDPEGTKNVDGGRTTWYRWLDLLETRGGVTDAATVFSRWALTPAQRGELAQRATARAAYAAVDEGDGAWLPPEGLRDAMTLWDFDRAASVHDQVVALGPAALAVQDAADRGDVSVPAVVRESYEAAEQNEHYAALVTSLPRAAEAITAVGEAIDDAARERDPVSDLGAAVLGVEGRADRAAALLDSGDLRAATAAASAASSRADRALLVGLAVPLLAGIAVLGLVLLARRLLARRRAVAHQPADPVTADPMTADPMTADPMTADPVTEGAETPSGESVPVQTPPPPA